jgi:hypothetical protein
MPQLFILYHLGNQVNFVSHIFWEDTIWLTNYSHFLCFELFQSNFGIFPENVGDEVNLFLQLVKDEKLGHIA